LSHLVCWQFNNGLVLEAETTRPRKRESKST